VFRALSGDFHGRDGSVEAAHRGRADPGIAQPVRFGRCLGPPIVHWDPRHRPEIAASIRSWISLVRTHAAN